MADVNTTLNDRAKTHGSFTDNAIVMQSLKNVCRGSVKWEMLTNTQREAIEMICHKLGRVLCGNPNHSDHWHDIAGYAQLEENILNTGSSHPTLTSTNPSTKTQYQGKSK